MSAVNGNGSSSPSKAVVPKMNLTKEMRELLNAELDRLYKVLDPNNTNAETVLWARGQITTIQNTLLGMVTATAVDVMETANTAAEVARDLTQNS